MSTNESTSLRDRLKKETDAEHRSLEARSRLMSSDLKAGEYLRTLVRWYFVYRAFEEKLAESRYDDLRHFMEGRSKIRMLEADLAQIDVGRINETGLGAWLAKVFSSEAALLGAIYVLEGSTLGGQVITRHLKTHFASTDESILGRLTFYSGYGADTGLKFRELLKTIAQFEAKSDVPTSGIATSGDGKSDDRDTGVGKTGVNEKDLAVESARCTFLFLAHFLEPEETVVA